MTLSNTNPRSDYTGNGATSVYAFTFKIFATSDLVVTKADTSSPPVETPLAFPTDFTVDNSVGNPNGGNITLVAGALPSGYHLAITRKRPLTQTLDIRNQGEYYPETLEDEYDMIVMIAQQLQEQVDRALTFQKTSIKTGFTMADPSALKYLRWNAAATAIENVDLTSGSGVGYTPPTSAVVIDATVQSAMDNLNPRFYGTRGAPNVLVAGTALIPTQKVIEQTWVISAAGPFSVSANPRVGLTGLVAGQKLNLIGSSDTNTITYDGDITKGMLLSGPCTLGKDTVLSLMFDGVNLVETGRVNDL